MSHNTLSVIGDNDFPQIGIGFSSEERWCAINCILWFLKSVTPDIVYLTPTTKTNIVIAVSLFLLGIPYILVFENRHKCIKFASNQKFNGKNLITFAKNIIIIEDANSKSTVEDYLKDSSDVLVIFRDKNSTMAKQIKTMKKHKKTILNIIYNSGEVVRE